MGFFFSSLFFFRRKKDAGAAPATPRPQPNPKVQLAPLELESDEAAKIVWIRRAGFLSTESGGETSRVGSRLGARACFFSLFFFFSSSMTPLINKGKRGPCLLKSIYIFLCRAKLLIVTQHQARRRKPAGASPPPQAARRKPAAARPARSSQAYAHAFSRSRDACVTFRPIC